MHTSHSGAAGRIALALLIIFLQAPPASADPPVQPDVNAHVIVGMTPNSPFHVTCDEDPLYEDPVRSNRLGILDFETPADMDGPPAIIWVGVPAAPVISDVRICATGDTTVLVCWNTDRPATSVVDYGLTSSYGASVTSQGSVTTTHYVRLNGLEPETLYHYRVTSVDAFGNTSQWQDQTFFTDAPHLRISDLRIEELKAHCLKLAWTTNKPADSRAVYGPSEIYGNATPLDPTPVTEHSVLIEDLTPGTTYYMRALSTDADGQAAISENINATTLMSDLEISWVTVVDTTSMTATIRWETAVNAVSNIEYGETEDYGLVHIVDEGYCTNHYAVLVGLEQETDYHFRVRCEDATGDIVNSEDHVFRTNHPSQDNLELYKVLPKYIGTDSAVIGWMSNLPASSRVEYGLTEEYGLEVSDPAYVTSHAIELPGLTENTTYHYRVLSTTEYGLEEVSDDATFTTWLSPLTITEVEIIPGVSSLTVNWVTNRPSDSRVEYGEDESYGDVTPLDPELVTEHSVFIDDLLPDQLYHIRAWSIDDWGYATSSGDHAAATLPPPLDIYEIEVTDISMTSACVEFMTSNPATCVVEYGLGDSLAQSTQEEPDPIVHHSIGLEGLAPGATYVYRIAATDHYGQVVMSGVASFETRPVEIQFPPSISELDVRGITATSARITWTTDRPTTSEVRYGLTSDYASSVYDPTMVTEHDVLLTGLNLTSLYHYSVASEDEDGLRSETPDATFAIIDAGDGMPPGTPDAPLVLATDAGLEVTVQGSPELAVVAHRIYRRAESELFYEMIAEVPAEEGSYTDAAVADGVLHEYTVAAVDLWGVESARSSAGSGIAGIGSSARLWVYPNPVRESATLRVAAPLSRTRGESWDYIIRIYDAAGRLVRSMSERGVRDATRNVRWDARDVREELVSSGVYFCEVEAAGARARAKLIVLR